MSCTPVTVRKIMPYSTQTNDDTSTRPRSRCSWRNLSNTITSERVAVTALTTTTFLGGYLTVHENTVTSSIETVALTIASYSLIIFTWAFSEMINGNYRKAAKLLGASVVFGTTAGTIFNLNEKYSPRVEFPMEGASNIFRNLITTPGQIPYGTEIRHVRWNVTAFPLAPPPIPQRSYAINREKANAWIERFPCAFQKEAARIYVDGIVYASHEHFMTYLKDSVGQFNQWIRDLGNPDYAIIVPNKARFTKQIKSNTWVTALALNFLEKAPKYNISCRADATPYYGQYLTVRQFREEHPEIKIYVLFDDATYSCIQMKDTALVVSEMITHDYRDFFYRWMGRQIPSIFQKEKYILATIIPLMQNPLCIQEKLHSIESTSEVRVFTTKKINRVNEVLTKAQMCSLGISFLDATKTLAYLNHKLPDQLSVPTSFIDLWTYNITCPKNDPDNPSSTQEEYFIKNCRSGIRQFWPKEDKFIPEEIPSPYKEDWDQNPSEVV